MPENHNHSLPAVSVIAAVYNGENTLNRAIQSVMIQSSLAWELLLIDDCSLDGSAVIIESWCQKDSRIKTFRTLENSGQSAARNLGLQNARGEMVCFLDQDDEFYSDYFAAIEYWKGKGDVLFFGYDFVSDDSPDRKHEAWRADRHFHNMFLYTVSTPLGVACRRSWAGKVGGFNELLWCNEDAELWRRFARAGADCVFVPGKSGRYHFRRGSQSHICRLTRKQTETFAAQWQAGQPVFGDRASPRPVRKVAFASPHCLIDYYSGAAIATSCALELLQSRGFQCRAFCGSHLDAPQELLIEDVLARQQSAYEVRRERTTQGEAKIFSVLHRQVPVTLFASASTRGVWQSQAELNDFLAAYERFLDEDRPDVVVTYGGNAAAINMMAITKRRDIPIVFAVHNCQYCGPEVFDFVDYVTAPSEFCRRYYWDTLGLACVKLPNVIDWQRATVSDRRPRYVTFVNPDPGKGVFVFARIAEVLAARRPDIPLLVVESRGQLDMLAEHGPDSRALTNIQRMEPTTDPREFYRVTKFILMPSVVSEVSPLVPAEAMLNGIPVIGSNRGGLPETVGSGGVLLDIPAAYTPTTCLIPSAEEIEPWVRTIVRLWDDAAFYNGLSEKAAKEAERWRPDPIGATYDAFFGNIVHQPAPPVIPRWDRLEELVVRCLSWFSDSL